MSAVSQNGNIRLFVARKSGIQRKTSQNGREYTVRYLTCQKSDDPSSAYCISLYPERDGTWLPIYTFSEIIVPFRDVRSSRVNAQYDKNIDGNVFRSLAWINGFKNNEIEITGKYFSKQMGVRINLDNVVFHTSFLETKSGNVKIDASELGFDYFPDGLNKVNLEGSIEIFAEFEYRLRAVQSKDKKGGKEFVVAYNYKEGSIDISRCDLSLLESAVSTFQEEARMKAFIKELRERIANGEFLSETDVNELASRHGVKVNAEEALENVTLKRDYEPRFFQMLKGVQKAETPIYYSDRGFIFNIGSCWVWEEPKYGSATYLFGEDRVTQGELLSLIQNAKKTEIYQNEEMRDQAGFIRRVIHPKDDEVDEYVQRWFKEVQQVA